MGKNDRRSRDQKRKAKLKKRAERSRKPEALAYHGQKYKTDAYIPILHQTEVGIYETYVMCNRKLVDNDVEAALGRLIVQMRQGPLPPLPETDELRLTSDDQDELIIWNIRRNWQILAGRGQLPGRDDLIGVLRTILHSLEIWRSQSLHSQGYLRYIEGFMKQTGVTVEQVTSDLVPLPAPEVDPLLELGRDGIDDDDPVTSGPARVEADANSGPEDDGTSGRRPTPAED